MDNFSNGWTAKIEKLEAENKELGDANIEKRNLINLLEAELAAYKAKNYDSAEQKKEITRLKADLALNASMLAIQCDMARVAEIEAMRATRENKELLEACKEIITEYPEPKLPYGKRIVEIAKEGMK